MQFIPVREFRLRPGTVWRKLAQEKELVLTARGKPVGLLTPLSSATFEETLQVLRRARGMLALESLQAQARRRGLSRLSPAQIDAEISRVRKSRRSSSK